MNEVVTCKLIFAAGSITKEQVGELLGKYTKDWNIATFNPEIEVGCNHMTFAVVDVPEDVVSKLFKENIVKDIDLLPTTKTRKCSSGCGCKKKS